MLNCFQTNIMLAFALYFIWRFVNRLWFFIIHYVLWLTYRCSIVLIKWSRERQFCNAVLTFIATRDYELHMEESLGQTQHQQMSAKPKCCKSGGHLAEDGRRLDVLMLLLLLFSFNLFNDPPAVFSDQSVNSRVSLIGTSVSPRNDTSQLGSCSCGENGTTRIALTGIFASCKIKMKIKMKHSKINNKEKSIEPREKGKKERRIRHLPL